MKEHSKLYEGFLKSLKDYAYSYPEFAGVTNLYLDDCDLAEDSHLLPESGDIVVYNDREEGGIIGMCHESGELHSVEFSEEFDHAFNDEGCVEPKKPLHISTEYLWDQYGYIASVFSTLHQDEKVDLGFDSHAELVENFNHEKDYFNNDPHLSLFWLIVFGLLDHGDKFQEVLALAPADHHLIQACVAFFKELSPDDDIDLSSSFDSEEDRAFLKAAFGKRRASLIAHYSK